LKRLTRGIHKTPPAAFANASLFIDDVPGAVCLPGQTVECVRGMFGQVDVGELAGVIGDAGTA
jgi:hypothetical protein